MALISLGQSRHQVPHRLNCAAREAQRHRNHNCTPAVATAIVTASPKGPHRQVLTISFTICFVLHSLYHTRIESFCVSPSFICSLVGSQPHSLSPFLTEHNEQRTILKLMKLDASRLHTRTPALPRAARIYMHIPNEPRMAAARQQFIDACRAMGASAAFMLFKVPVIGKFE
ncbi:hypothetical protein K437DRAFT_52096 [Tilletiaria anomala UBC 951]|uniref:Uncharacterized protein n=1 Tax=Tilletiaria anomala (strain ATCC 24038 / CBS 436.72 / UBC 951) TaxID=1037660 RepID=A0A066WFZ9_TILAU|nr:uncharacterized protein K437DRAFT_52096 [Tilletiaria anomala UBC 951]KDN51448.1 hypothetical protein K437DRAFT_52096 [Tilletiaria anomala UBC 951]